MTKDEYYVYVLQDSTQKLTYPDKNGLKFKPFYVGKGKGARSSMHELNADKYGESHNRRLLAEIKKIQSLGGRVITSKIFHSEDEDEVYDKESETILFYGLRFKDGILVNAGTGRAGGWGGNLNPTYDRMDAGTHNFLKRNPQIESPKVRKLTKMIKEVDTSIDIKQKNWLSKSGYYSLKALKLGINRIILRGNLPYKLTNNKLEKI